MSASEPTRPPAPPQPPAWLDYLEHEEWAAFCEVHEKARAAKIDLLLGGGMGLSAYMPLRRRTKDIDFYIRPTDRDAMVAVLEEAGFSDYYAQLPYDRKWIYRGTRGGVIVDLIWSFANYLTAVDEEWFRHSRRMPAGEMEIAVIPAEEFLWAKLFVFQRERFDWPDLLNLIYYAGPGLDWERLRARLGPDVPLLDSLLGVFRWLCPGRLPEGGQAGCKGERAALLDSRDWFLPQGAPSTA